MLIHNHVISRLDYCNLIYHKLPNILLKKTSNIRNRAARLIKIIPLRERITPALMELHWLPMKARIIYKICLLIYKALKFGEPKYLYEYLVPFELETSVTIRHASDRHRLFEPRTNRCSGERSFQHSAPRLYNKRDRFSVALYATEERSHENEKLRKLLCRISTLASRPS